MILKDPQSPRLLLGAKVKAIWLHVPHDFRFAPMGEELPGSQKNYTMSPAQNAHICDPPTMFPYLTISQGWT